MYNKQSSCPERLSVLASDLESGNEISLGVVIEDANRRLASRVGKLRHPQYASQLPSVTVAAELTWSLTNTQG